MHKTKLRKIFSLPLITFIILLLYLYFSHNYNIAMANSSGASSDIQTYQATISIDNSISIFDYVEWEEGCKYTAKSSNTKILTMDGSDGRTHNHGNATITISRTKRGKTSVIAKIKVTVVPAKLQGKSYDIAVHGTCDPIQYENYAATYYYKSSDSSVVTTTAYTKLLGVSPGTAYVTVTEKFHGKTTVLGKIKVTVVASYLPDKEIKISYWDGDWSNSNSFDIESINYYATYTFTSDHPKIVNVRKDTGEFYGVNYGKAKITVTETYNNKKKIIGTVNIEVMHGTINPKTVRDQLYKDSYYDLFEIVNFLYYNWDATYYAVSADSSIIGITDDGYINARKEGLTQLSIHEKYKGVDYLIGSIDIAVIEPVVTGIDFIIDAYDDLSTLYLGTDYSDLFLDSYIQFYPDEASDSVTYSSSNENIFRIIDNEYIETVAEGKASIIASSANHTVELPVTVKMRAE